MVLLKKINQERINKGEKGEKYMEKTINSNILETRPSWDEYFMAQAQLISTRSTCDRAYVGCVLVRDNRIITSGYNGSISGSPHCSEVGHLMHEGGCKRTVHAEMNAILECAKEGIPTKGATAYVTHYPCPNCMRELNQAGIKEVVYLKEYAHRFENDFDKGMKLRKYEGRELAYRWN